jgi:hypothetical protein
MALLVRERRVARRRDAPRRPDTEADPLHPQVERDPVPAWRFPLAVLGGLTAAALVKFWPLLRPWERVSFGGDLTLGIDAFFYGQLKRGVVRLWDPTIVTGGLTLGGGAHTPFSSPSLLHLFYPPGLLVFGLAERGQHIPHFWLVCFVVAHFVAAGGFTVLYARALGIGRAGAFLAGATFMLSTFLLSHFAHWHMVATFAWLPLALYAIDRVLARPSVRAGALAAVPLALSFLAGHPQAFVYVALAVALATLWGLGGLVHDRRSGSRWPATLAGPAGALGVTAAFAALLGALLWLPALDARLWERQPSELYDFGWKAQGSLPPSLLPKLLLPNATTGLPGAQHSETALYLGVLPLVLALLGAACARARAARFHAGLALLALGLAFGSFTPLYRLAYDLVPGIAMNRIPGRALVLFTFSTAVLAGFGADLLLAGARSARRPAARTARLVGRVLALFAAVTVAVLVVMLAVSDAAGALGMLLIDLSVLLALLGGAWALLRVATRRGPPRLLARGLLALVLVDLLFWGAIFGGGERNPDAALQDNPDVIEFLRRDAEPFRLGLRDTQVIAVPHLYRFGWPVYDEENRLLPPAVQDLYFLTEVNPRIVDLLNVRYVVGGRHRTGPTKYATLDVSASVPEKVIPLDGLPPVGTITLASRMTDARAVAQGTTVAMLALEFADAPALMLPVRAGLESAEWAWDHPLEARPLHDQAQVVRTWPVPGHGFVARDYGTAWRLEGRHPPARLRLQYRLDRGGLAVSSLRLDAVEVTTRPTRFRPVHRGVEENRHALPRAFFVPALRVVPERRERLALMERFDPEALALVSAAPAGVDLAALTTPAPLEPGEGVRVQRARWNEVRIQATSGRPRLLVVSETWNRWWSTEDNGRPVPTLVVDHALRGVVLGPGEHDVVFRFRYPIFTVAVVLTLAGWMGLGAVLLAGRLRRRPAA